MSSQGSDMDCLLSWCCTVACPAQQHGKIYTAQRSGAQCVQHNVSCQKRAVAYQRSLLKAIDKLVPQVGAAGYKATPSYAVVQYWSKLLVSFLTFCLDMR